MNRTLIAAAILSLFFSSAHAAAPGLAAGKAEADKCEQEINAMKDEILSGYQKALMAMQISYQKAADLESALTVRAELNRVKTEETLTEQSFVAEPKALRDLQVQTYGKIREYWTQILNNHLPRLSELKKNLTIDGNLDDAVAVRDLIGQLQDKYGTPLKIEAGTVIPVDTLLRDYAADRDRADKLYKGKKITVSGSVAGFAQDQADENIYNVYLTARGATAVVQCAFYKQNFLFKEEKQGLGNIVLSILPRRGGKNVVETKLFKGMMLNIEGTCNGMDQMVILSKCNFPGR